MLNSLRGVPTVADVFRSHARFVAGIALRQLGRDDEVDDIVQDVFVISMRALPQLRDAGALRSWLATTTIRLVRRRLRLRRIGLLLRLQDRVDPAALAGNAGRPELGALVARLNRALRALPGNERNAWLLRYMQEERLEDVAARCGCSLATVKRRIAAAQRAVMRVLDDGDNARSRLSA